jgi:hypothetical protein
MNVETPPWGRDETQMDQVSLHRRRRECSTRGTPTELDLGGFDPFSVEHWPLEGLGRHP